MPDKITLDKQKVKRKMIKIFILEDDDNRIKQFRKNFINADLTIVKNSKDAIKILRKEFPYDYFILRP